MAEVIIQSSEDGLTAFLQGEIDHHSAEKIRARLDSEILCRMPKITVMDFSKITFMDSSGVGLILGRHKLCETIGGILVVHGVPQSLNRILNLAGITHVINCKGEQTV